MQMSGVRNTLCTLQVINIHARIRRKSAFLRLFQNSAKNFIFSWVYAYTYTTLLQKVDKWRPMAPNWLSYYPRFQDHQSQLSKNYVTLCKFCPSNWCKYGSLMLIRCTQTNRTATTWNWNDQRHFHDHVFCWFITLIGPGNLICSSVSYNIQYTLHKEQLNLWAVPLAAQTSPVYQVTGDRNKDVDVYFALWLD